MKFGVGRAIAEFFVIAAGVLAGLAADEWREDRQDAALTDSYMRRLAADLRTDSARWSGLEPVLLRKEDALDSVMSWLRNPNWEVEALAEVAADLTAGAALAYSALTQAERTTFDELVSSGRLDLITDPDVRAELQAYYARVDLNGRRLEARVTRYAPLAYELVPRDSEATVSTGLGEGDLRRIGERVLRSEVEGAAIAEKNRSRERRRIADRLHRQVADLLRRVDEP
jgi:hypothetical protein